MATQKSRYAVVGCRHCNCLWILEDLREADTAQCRQCSHTHQTERLRPLAECDETTQRSVSCVHGSLRIVRELRPTRGSYWGARASVSTTTSSASRRLCRRNWDGPVSGLLCRDGWLFAGGPSTTAPVTTWAPWGLLRPLCSARRRAVLGDVVNAGDQFDAYYGTDRDPTHVSASQRPHTTPETDAGRPPHIQPSFSSCLIYHLGVLSVAKHRHTQ